MNQGPKHCAGKRDHFRALPTGELREREAMSILLNDKQLDNSIGIFEIIPISTNQYRVDITVLFTDDQIRAGVLEEQIDYLEDELLRHNIPSQKINSIIIFVKKKFRRVEGRLITKFSETF